MLELSKRGLLDQEGWEQAGVALPLYDPDRTALHTLDHPRWVHFGAGNLFRSLIAKAQQKLLNEGLTDTGILAAGMYGSQTIARVYRPHDNLSLLVEMGADGQLRKEVLASVCEALCADPREADDYGRLVQAFENPSLQLVSFTVTEKGYVLKLPGGQPTPEALRDFESGPQQARQAMAAACALAYRRYAKGAFPLAFVSLDNCPHNGDVLKLALTTTAKEWARRGLVEEGFVRYLEDPQKVSFPLTMIDKITPGPSPFVQEELRRLGIGGMGALSSSGSAAPFVNAEAGELLVIEDRFPAGRPPLEAAGIRFADRDTVNRTDAMKVTACLNPLHTALAVTGCLLGYDRISDEMSDPLLRRLVEVIGYDEGLPVVPDPGILSPKAFLDEVLQERLPNPFIPDTPQRIASDTSQKIGIRFGRTIRAHADIPGEGASALIGIPLAIAAWCRYLLGIDDEGRPFRPSPDPLLSELQERLGNRAPFRVGRILSDESLFGVDLYAAGLGTKIENLFRDMQEGSGAVRRTLERELGRTRSLSTADGLKKAAAQRRERT